MQQKYFFWLGHEIIQNLKSPKLAFLEGMLLKSSSFRLDPYTMLELVIIARNCCLFCEPKTASRNIVLTKSMGRDFHSHFTLATDQRDHRAGIIH